ncbi:phospholipase D-like domain-containing protein [Aquabacterium sp.]|uniref:phospholipase D-like domain-containing protein n=1 Tax=Aquabacterium sp. TaxID=1872578 RepID=UPI002C717D9D|nr:phospholipase D-like domain-containing protein [Aquabacterium sp.]HSW04607.1 phospholipase D-like domain-containing protein [Aquabacterium sp.]
MFPATSTALQLHARTLVRCLGEPLLGGNRVRLLLDGPAASDALFRAITQARDHINIESYVIEPDGPGAELARRLIERCRAGVQVNLLFDSVSAMRGSAPCFDALREAGVSLCEYNPARRLSTLLSHALHLRDHRKLMVVDGRIGFIGGVNFAAVHSAGSSAPRSRDAAWRDTHALVEGPVVARLQRLFVAHWQRFASEALPPARYFPPLPQLGTQQVGVAACDAGRRRNPYYGALLGAIDSARHRILLTSAHQVPPRRLQRALMRAAGRGVAVHLLLPASSDSWAPLQPGGSPCSQLLRAGVRIHERHDALLHAKTCVVDGVWASVGSSNTDWRRFVHNAEADLMVVDSGFADQLERSFCADVAQAVAVEPANWGQRSWLDRCKDLLARRLEYFL